MSGYTKRNLHNAKKSYSSRSISDKKTLLKSSSSHEKTMSKLQLKEAKKDLLSSSGWKVLAKICIILAK